MKSGTVSMCEEQGKIDVAAMFEQHHAMVYRAAWRITGNAGDAEDVLQTVFLRLLRRDREAETVGNMESYLRRAAVNAALDLVRGRSGAPGVPLEDLEATLEQQAYAPPDRVLASREIRQWLRATVARLSPLAAGIFALRFYEGKDNPEIARILGTTEGTVAVTLSRARDRVRKEYERYFGGSYGNREQRAGSDTL